MRIFQLLLFTLLIFMTGIVNAAQLDYNSLPENVNSAYWDRFKENPTRTVIPLIGQWQYQRLESDATDGTVTVPAVTKYKGTIIYRKIININSSYKNKEFSLKLEGVSYRTIIRFNNEYLGTIKGAYTPSELHIPRELILFDKKNVLELQVSNQLDYELTIPTGPQFNLWKIDNGIFREIYLLVTNQVKIEEQKTYQTFAGTYKRAQLWTKTKIRKRVRLSSDKSKEYTGNYYLEIALYRNSQLEARKQSYNIRFDDSAIKEQTLSLTVKNLKLWSPEEPNIYRLRTTVFETKNNKIIDRNWRTIGFHDIRTAGNTFILNGEPFQLKGIDYPQFFPNLGEMLAIPVAKKDLLLIKSTGANAILTGGRPVPEIMLQLADEVGLFVLQEFQAYFTPGSRLGDQDFIIKATNQFEAMVKAGRNHPSIFAWGIGKNFDTHSDNASSYLSAIKMKLKEIDNHPLFLTTNLLSRDKVGYSLDFILIDTFTWGTENLFLKQLSIIKQRYPGKPVVLSGIGRICQPGNNRGSLNPLSEEAQAVFIENAIHIAQSTKIIDGLIIHSFSDYLTENSNNFGFLVGNMKYWPSGIFNMERKERPAVKIVRSAFLNETMEPIITGNEPGSPGFWFIGPALFNLLFFGIVYKNSLRFRENIKRSLGHPFGFFSEIRDRRIIPLPQSIWLAALISLNGGIFYASLAYHYRLSVLSGYIFDILLPEGYIRNTLFILMWKPIIAILVFTLVIMLFFTFNGFVIRFFALFARGRIFLRQCLSLSYWSATNYVLLILPGLFYFSILTFPDSLKWVIIIWAFFHIWFFFRLINSTRILLDVQFVNIFMALLFIFFFFFILYVLYMHNTYNSLDYLTLLQNIIAEQRW